MEPCPESERIIRLKSQEFFVFKPTFDSQPSWSDQNCAFGLVVEKGRWEELSVLGKQEPQFLSAQYAGLKKKKLKESQTEISGERCHLVL